MPQYIIKRTQVLKTSNAVQPIHHSSYPERLKSLAYLHSQEIEVRPEMQVKIPQSTILFRELKGKPRNETQVKVEISKHEFSHSFLAILPKIHSILVLICLYT